MLHLLREESITRAVEHYKDPEGIPERNMAFAKKKGLQYMQLLRAACLEIVWAPWHYQIPYFRVHFKLSYVTGFNYSHSKVMVTLPVFWPLATNSYASRISSIGYLLSIRGWNTPFFSRFCIKSILPLMLEGNGNITLLPPRIFVISGK